MKKYLTIDLERNRIKWSIVSDDLEVLETGKMEIISVEEKDAVMKPIEAVGERYRGTVEGMVLTMPGVIDSERGIAYSGGMYPWIVNEPIGKELSEAIGMPVVIVNDAKAATLAEVGYGSLKHINYGVMLMILGTGIGGAVINEGRILDGGHHAAGEFSYMGDDCKKRKIGGDIFALSMSLNALVDIVKETTGNDKMNVMKIMFGLNTKDPLITEGVNIYCDRLANYIYNIQCVIDADRFVIGGSVTEEPLFIRYIEEALQRRFDNAPYHHIFQPEIKSTAFHDDSRKFGAVYLFKKMIAEGKISC